LVVSGQPFDNMGARAYNCRIGDEYRSSAMTNEEKPHRHPLDDVLPEETRQHMRAAREEMRRGMESLFPPGLIEHRRAARKEMLLAARSLIDSAIQRIERRQHETETKV
jgi:hypothetical protein